MFGAAALGSVTELEAERTLELLLEYGVNHIDTAASYGDSELRLGPFMAAHRQRFFLATKTGKRTYSEAKAEFSRSLERLRVPSVDLIQLHCLVEPAEWETALGPGGALEALIEARQNKLVRFIGVTGHGLTAPSMHLRALERFEFDSVLFPYSFMMMKNPDYAADVQRLLSVCQERNVAVQTIKSVTLRPFFEGEVRTHTTWYAPFTEQSDIDQAVHWVLDNPQVFLNTPGDIGLLPKVLAAAARFSSAPDPELLEARARELGAQPLFA
ncbi:MAG TPA: aldo/keto reductase [Polyangiaceae bacterium]|nr:aldo/keto reductase [Polyangiaceae bacterium]